MFNFPALVSISQGRVVFRGLDFSFNSGLYYWDGQVLDKIIAAGDALGAKTVNDVTFLRDGFAGNRITFVASYQQGGSGVWLATIGGQTTTPVPMSIANNGSQIAVSWDAAIAGPGAILQSTTNIALPDWQPVASQTDPYILPNLPNLAAFFRLMIPQ
jgi:hypothetical protein